MTSPAPGGKLPPATVDDDRLKQDHEKVRTRGAIENLQLIITHAGNR